MFLVALVCYVVFMCFWLFGVGGWYMTRWTGPERPALLGSVLVPWLCVLIIGLIVFGAIPMTTAR